MELLLLAAWAPLEKVYAILVLALVDLLLVGQPRHSVDLGLVENLEVGDRRLDLDEAVTDLRHHFVRIREELDKAKSTSAVL